MWHTVASWYDVFLWARTGSLPRLTFPLKLWKPARVKSLLICVMKAWCFYSCGDVMGWDRNKCTISSRWLPGDATYVIDLSLRCPFFHHQSVHLKSGQMTRKTTWNYGREGKRFGSRLLNIPRLLTGTLHRSSRGQGCYHEKLASLTVPHLAKWQRWLQQKNQSPPPHWDEYL